MNRTLIIWGSSALVIVVIPLSIISLCSADSRTGRDLVVVNGVPENPVPDNEGANPDSDEIVQIVESSPLQVEPVSRPDLGEPLSVDALSIVQATPQANPAALAGKSLNTQFYGGGKKTEPAGVVLDNTTAGDVGTGMVALQGSPTVMPTPANNTTNSDLPDDFPIELLLEQPGKKKIKKTVDKEVPKVAKEDDRPRVEISILRPKSKYVNSLEDIIGKTKVKGHPIVLVRSRQVGSTWWVQEVMPRKGAYFRAVAQFGNKKTINGTRFQYVVAFVKDINDVPETGANYRNLPAEFQLSQEFEVIVKKDE